jgi:uncharacterized protein YoxC
MENVMLAAASIALLCLGAFLIYAIRFLMRTTQSLTHIEQSLDKVSNTTDKLEKNLQVTLQEANLTLQQTRESLVKADDAIVSISQLAATTEVRLQEMEQVIATSNQIVSTVRNFEQKIVDKIDGPVMGTLNVVSALYKGIGAMISAFPSPKPSQPIYVHSENEDAHSNEEPPIQNKQSNGIPLDSIIDGVVAVTKIFQQFTKK